ncbi:MAG: histone deacetylase [Chloroflexi bacterium]|nr:MAG: histone deacetylase [Chloroflexota bacterium]
MTTDERLTVLLLTDPALAGHTWPGHPERPERIAAVVAGVVDGATTAGAELVERTADPAPVDLLASVHDPRYVAWLATSVETGGWLDADTYVVADSPNAAMLATGLTVAAAMAASRGEAAVAFAAVRPPGHHAGREGGKGFCLLNNVAVAVAALRAAGAAERVAVLDWDVHHGDGSEALFANDQDVFYASSHQYPWYPGTGSSFDQGETLLNAPLSAGSGDEEFIAAWGETILPRIAAFGPDAILVSAGYDAHRDDPLAGLEVTEHGFGEVARAVGELARATGVGGVGIALEGGYDLDALRASAAATVAGLVGGLRSAPNGERGN